MAYQLRLFVIAQNEFGAPEAKWVLTVPFTNPDMARMAKLAIELDNTYTCELVDCNGTLMK